MKKPAQFWVKINSVTHIGRLLREDPSCGERRVGREDDPDPVNVSTMRTRSLRRIGLAHDLKAATAVQPPVVQRKCLQFWLRLDDSITKPRSQRTLHYGRQPQKLLDRYQAVGEGPLHVRGGVSSSIRAPLDLSQSSRDIEAGGANPSLPRYAETAQLRNAAQTPCRLAEIL